MPKSPILDTLPFRPDWPRIDSAIPKDAAMEARIATIVASMSLQQKVGQITQPEIQSITPDEVRQHYIGSVFSGGGSWPDANKHASPSEWLRLADAYWDASMSTDSSIKIPIMWGIDAIHGNSNVFGATLFPHNVGLGATRDPDLIRQIGAATARQLRVTGQDWTFAPTVAVVRDDRWGRTYEGYAEHPAIAQAYGRTIVEGLQDTEASDRSAQHRLGDDGVIATAKHFIGDGGTDQGRDQGVNTASVADMINIHGEGFFSALAAGAQAVMVSYSSWTNEALGIVEGKLHGSQLMLTDVLKEKIGFDGLVISDSNGVGQVPGCSNFRCAQAINAGIDMVMVPTDWRKFISHTIDLVERGDVPMSRIDDAVTRILRVKFRVGLFDSPKPSGRPYAGDLSQLMHRELAREAVQKSLALLKNNNNVLPLARNQRVLVVGKSADSLPNQTGGWSLTWQGTHNCNDDFPNGSTILAGIRDAIGGEKLVFSEDAESVDVTNFDVIIAVIGERPYAESGGDIGRNKTLEHCSRYPEDLAVLDNVSGKGVPVVTILISGRPLYVNKELNRSDAFIAAWLPGTDGEGVIDVLFRKANGDIDKDFQGALSYSWPRTARQTPLNHGDADYEPLFPYGYGLSYKSAKNLPLLDEFSPRDLTKEVGSRDIATQDLAIYVQSSVAPYRFYVGSPASWSALVGDDLDGPVASPEDNVTVQAVNVNAVSDGRLVTWTGLGPGQVCLQSSRTADLRAYLNADGVLAFDAIVNQAPLGFVKMRIDCVWPCCGEWDATTLFRDMPLNLKQTVTIPLSYFAASGADFSAIDTVFLIYTEQAFSLSIANVRWMLEAVKESV